MLAKIPKSVLSEVLFVSLFFSHFINSDRLMPKESASGSNVFISGNPKPLSQRLTALSVTFNLLAKSACVICFSFLRLAINKPNFFASITMFLLLILIN